MSPRAAVTAQQWGAENRQPIVSDGVRIAGGRWMHTEREQSQVKSSRLMKADEFTEEYFITNTDTCGRLISTGNRNFY